MTYSGAYHGLRTRPLLSDYTWNHTTLWAMKTDEAYTYLQCGFDPDTVREQIRRLKRTVRQRDSFSHGVHEEWRRAKLIPGAIPLVYFTTEERLNEMIDFCREIGVFVANPHVNNVEGGGRYRRRQRATARQAALRPERSAEPRQNGNLSAGDQATGVTHGTMKTWIPDARNFAYLNWKQVDALPRDIDAADSAHCGHRAARPSSAARHRHAHQ